MARISGVDLPKAKRVEVGLTYIYGIGLSTAKNILKETGVNGDIRVKDLSEEEVEITRRFLEKYYKAFIKEAIYKIINPKK